MLLSAHIALGVTAVIDMSKVWRREAERPAGAKRLVDNHIKLGIGVRTALASPPFAPRKPQLYSLLG